LDSKEFIACSNLTSINHLKGNYVNWDFFLEGNCVLCSTLDVLHTETLLASRPPLGQNIIYCFCQSMNDISQHLWIFKIHRQTIIHSKLKFDFVVSKVQLELV
jgi:hypothetical protein